MHDKQFKQFTATLTVNDGERSVVASITTNSLDRDGEVLIPQGCDATDFLKSPTVFFNHDYEKPIGRCTDIRREPNSLIAKTRFATKPEDHTGEWLPDTVLSLFQQGVLSGFSVGFVPIESRRPSKKDRTQFGDRVVRVYSKWKLLEYSVAPLPANQDALVTAVSKGLIEPAFAKQLLPEIALPKKPKRKVFIVVGPQQIKRPPVDPQAAIKQTIDKMRGRIYANS